jgi:hypothetical protein
MFGVHPELRRHLFVSFVASALLGVAGACALMAFAMNAGAVRDVPAWVLVGFGLFALAVTYLGTVAGPRWYRNSSLVVSSVQPVEGTAVLRMDPSLDSTSLYARLEPPAGSSAFPSHEIAVLFPRWDVAELLQSPVPASIYIDPATSRAAAIKTSRGLLWTISGSRASGRAPSIPRPPG